MPLTTCQRACEGTGTPFQEDVSHQTHIGCEGVRQTDVESYGSVGRRRAGRGTSSENDKGNIDRQKSKQSEAFFITKV